MARTQIDRFNRMLDVIGSNLNTIKDKYPDFADALMSDINAVRDIENDAEKKGSDAAKKELSYIVSLFESGKPDEARDKINNTIKDVANASLASLESNSNTNKTLLETSNSTNKEISKLMEIEKANANMLKDTDAAYADVKNAMEAGFNKYIRSLDKELGSKTKLDYKSSRKTGLRMLGNNILNSFRSGKVGIEVKNTLDDIKKDMEDALKGHTYADTKSIQAEIDEMFKAVTPQQTNKAGGIKNMVKSGAMGSASAGMSTYGANSLQQKIDLYTALKTSMGSALDSKNSGRTNELKKTGSEAVENAKDNIKKAFESNFSKINNADEEKDYNKVGTVAYFNKINDLLGTLGSARRIIETTGNIKSGAKYIKDHIEGKDVLNAKQVPAITLADNSESKAQALRIKTFIQNPETKKALGFESDRGLQYWIKNNVLPVDNGNRAYKDFMNNTLSTEDSTSLMAAIYARLVRNNSELSKYISEEDLASMEYTKAERAKTLAMYNPKKVDAIGKKLVLAEYLEASKTDAKKNNVQSDAKVDAFAERGFRALDILAYITSNLEEYNAALKKLRDTGSYLAPLFVQELATP
ncbi:MAG: hypothetical protein M1128_03495 [Candidatus Marsarchaeota archaeon]|nr:hypothetical protein [Candidatus Marsarchaeota archaeon]